MAKNVALLVLALSSAGASFSPTSRATHWSVSRRPVVGRKELTTAPPLSPTAPTLVTSTRLRGGSAAATALAVSVAPKLGTFLANAMFAAGLPTILRAREAGTLGNLNVAPFAMIVGNCAAWLIYGLLVSNPYIVLSNAPGLLCGLFMVLSGASIGNAAQRKLLERLVLGMSFGLICSGGVISFGGLTAEGAATLAVTVANVFTFAFYAAPLAGLSQVLKARSSASMVLPMIVASWLNAALWTVYGLAISNLGVWLPNSFGVFLATLQLAIFAAFKGA